MPRLSRLSALLLTALTGWGVTSCDPDSGPTPVDRIAPVSSLAASATVGSSVTLQLVAEDADGNPMEGVRMELAVASGGGSVQPDSATTGTEGTVSAVWTLGTAAGEQALAVTARGQSETLRIQAEPGDPTRLVLLSSEEVVGTVGQALSSPVRVRLQDRYENPVPERRVTFRPRSEGNGTVSAGGAATDAQGTASTTWTLGAEAGEQWLDAHSQGVALVTVRATARADAPAVVEALAGDEQTGPVGEALSVPLMVRVTDAYENPVPGARVSFTPGEGAGSAQPIATGADEEGRARSTWTLGTEVGARTLTATVEGMEEGVVFHAQAVPGPPAEVEIVSGDGQEGYAGSPLDQPVVVRVRDEYGNRAPFAVVVFDAGEGSGSAAPESVTADGEARAAATWTLGPSTGSHTLEARSGGAPPATFTATAGSHPPAEIRVLSGDGQTARVGSELSEAVGVQVLDMDGNPVQDASVELTVTAGGGSVGESPVSTDGEGRATATWTLGTEAGAQTLEARVAPVEEPAVFTATATPGDAVSLAVAAGDQQSAPVGQALADPVTVRAQDEFGNGVEAIEVAFQVTGGGGSVTPASATTDGQGHASATWTLGTEAGENALEASADGLGSAGFTATGTSAAPDRIETLSGDGQTGPVAAELPEPVRVRVLDEFGNPLEGVSVEFAPSGSQASATPGVASTDAQGEASATWTLATGAGEQTMEARVSGVEAPAAFSATATPGPPAALSRVSGDGQAAVTGDRLDEPFVVRVADEYDNPIQDVTVAWSVVQGNGSLDASSRVTDAQGRASVGYTAGSTFGEEKVQAAAEGLESVVFTALVGNNLTIAGLYLTQSAQPFDGSSPLVAGRDGLIRIFARAGAANTYTPDVRLDIYRNGSLVETHTLSAAEGSVRTEVTEGPLSASWNLAVPGSLVEPGLAIRAEVDPENQIGEVDEDDNVYPAGGGSLPLDVRRIPEFMAHLIPVDVDGSVGRVDEGNMHDYMTDVYAMMPMPDYDVNVRETYTASITDTDDFGEWVDLLNELWTLRNAEGSERYYYGVIRAGSGAPFCGLGYVGAPASLGVDSCGAGTAAHEWGHNWGRYHAPCGNPGNPDEDYPYPDGSIGVWGLNPFTGELKDPDEYKDLMSYCGPEWTSDYTYDGVLDFREDEAAEAAALRAPVEESLILWGRISPQGLVLEPAFRSVTRPALPRQGGPYRVRGLAADGTELFRLSFAGLPVDHGPDGHRGFAFAVPVEEIRADALERLVLEGPAGMSAARSRSAPPVEDEARIQARRAGSGRVRVTWNEAVAPVAVVRNPVTGRILSLARGGEAVVQTGAAELELELAGGVDSVRRLVGVR